MMGSDPFSGVESESTSAGMADLLQMIRLKKHEILRESAEIRLEREALERELEIQIGSGVALPRPTDSPASPEERLSSVLSLTVQQLERNLEALKTLGPESKDPYYAVLKAETAALFQKIKHLEGYLSA